MIKFDIPVEKLKKKYAHPESKFIEVDGLLVHYRDEGNSLNNIPLVLIHGTSSSLHTWDVCTETWKKSHRVIRFDIPAFGLTGPNKEHDYSFKHYVDFVNKVLNILKINKCYLAGNSLGGGIAWEFAYAYPNRVEKLILLDAMGYDFKLGKGGIGFKLISVFGKIPIANISLNYITPYSIVKKSVEGVYYDKSKIKQETIDRYIDFTLRKGNRRALVERLIIPLEDGSSRIKEVKTQTLIIWGENDELIPIECA